MSMPSPSLAKIIHTALTTTYSAHDDYPNENKTPLSFVIHMPQLPSRLSVASRFQF